MMTVKNKGSFLMTLGILLTVDIASLIISSENFAEEIGQADTGVTFYGKKEPLKAEGVIKPIEQPVTDEDEKTSQQQDKVNRKITTKTSPTNAQTSLPRTGKQNSTWLYSFGTTCLLVVLTSFYHLNEKRKKEK